MATQTQIDLVFALRDAVAKRVSANRDRQFLGYAAYEDAVTAEETALAALMGVF